jgi:hypothetical protein
MKLFSPHTFMFNKKKRFDPHMVWEIFCASFVILLIGLLGYFSWYFLNTTARLDGPAVVNLQTNSVKIKAMEKILSDAETVVNTRIGTSVQQ